MIDPKDEPKIIILLKERLSAKKTFIKFTEMEIAELERTLEKYNKDNNKAWRYDPI